jgi:hypothetical protein
MEVINLDSVELSSSPSVKLNIDGPAISAPSMTGAELLMNTKKKSESDNNNDINVDVDDLNSLEKELNDLTIDSANSEIKLTIDEPKVSSPTIKLNSDPIIEEPSLLGSIKNTEPQKTWDGYQQMNNLPINPDVKKAEEMTKEQLLREKFNYLRKLEALEKKGIRLSKQYTMESSLHEMMGEYETIKSEKEKSNSVKFQGRMLMAAVTGLEFLNNRFDPFDFKLDGWSEQVNENVSDYDEIFGELHEKYSSKAKMAPELKLLFQLSGSAIMLHMTNTMFKSSMPGMDDILKQNPELMQQFTQAAVNQMGDERPGFGNFMNGVMNQNTEQHRPSPGPPINQGPPPQPLRTKNPGRMDNFKRPDIGFGRGAPEPGININDNFDSPNKPERSVRRTRPEMKGPSQDINELLSGLKTKPPVSRQPTSTTNSKIEIKKEGSPRRRGRPTSERNTVSLDI